MLAEVTKEKLKARQFESPQVRHVDSVIQRRKTLKIYGDLHKPVNIPSTLKRDVDQAIQVANWAPFHYPAHKVHRKNGMKSIVPWRFYALDQKACLNLASCLISHKKVKAGKKSKIVRMLAASGSLVLVTWLPEPTAGANDKKLKKIYKRNEEHLAAASAATQNLLLAGEARGLQTYWSSGGILESQECFGLCNILEQERLLGAIFMFPESSIKHESKAGSLRNKRGDMNTWMSWVDIN